MFVYFIGNFDAQSLQFETHLLFRHRWRVRIASESLTTGICDHHTWRMIVWISPISQVLKWSTERITSRPIFGRPTFLSRTAETRLWWGPRGTPPMCGSWTRGRWSSTTGSRQSSCATWSSSASLTTPRTAQLSLKVVSDTIDLLPSPTRELFPLYSGSEPSSEILLEWESEVPIGKNWYCYDMTLLLWLLSNPLWHHLSQVSEASPSQSTECWASPRDSASLLIILRHLLSGEMRSHGKLVRAGWK